MPKTLLPEAPLASEPVAIEAWERGYLEEHHAVLHAAPRLTLSEWADRYGHLSNGAKWDTSVVPYLREVMDATTDRRTREVVVAKCARVGYTEGVIGQRVGYDIHQDPERILVVLPTADDAADWSQKQLTPMIEATPELDEIVPEARGRDSGNKILDKVFAGGSITIRGAHSPKGLRRHTARDVILDEVDGFEVSSRDEGDPVMLSTRANRTLPDRKTIMGSTPGVKIKSRVWKALGTSDWREYHVPCPLCDALQVLEWGGPEKEYGLKWARDVHCQGCGSELQDAVSKCPDCGSQEFTSTHHPETAHYVCRHCLNPFEEHHKPGMLASGEWIPRYPGRQVRGYHINGLMSPFEGANWVNMIREFLKSKDDPALLQVWVNQWLGEPWEEKGEKVKASDLEERAEVFVGSDGSHIDVPDGVGVLTAGVDVQHDRLELLVRGYGVAWETWDILHERIYGAPQVDDTWARLEHYLLRAYRHQNGGAMRILSTMVDSGDGNTSEAVYRFVRPRDARKVWASKGDNGQPGNPVLRRPSRANADGVKVWSIGTFPTKASLMYRLGVTRPGKNFIHLRQMTPGFCNGFDAEYFAQFGAEEKVRIRVGNSRTYRWAFVQKRKRNEAIDLHGLADSAFRALGSGVVENMQEWVALAGRRPPEKDEGGEEAKPQARRRRRGRGWADGWK